MRCVSCGEDIPPKWVAVIEKNICPSCDGPIMTNDAIQLRDELADALAKMPNDPQGITGWILSNYKVQKIGIAEPVDKFNRPGAVPNSPPQVPDGPQFKEFKIATSPYDEYLSRTDMKNKVQETKSVVRSKQDRMAQMAANIAAVQDPYGDLTRSEEEPTAEADQEDYIALQEMLAESSGARRPKGGALSPQQIIGMQKNSYASDMANVDIDGVARSNVGYNDEGLSAAEELLIQQTGDLGFKVVHNNRLKRIKGQEAIDTGGGSFTRSG